MTRLSEHLALVRPIAVWDLEATGPSAENQDCIVEFAAEVHFPDGEVNAWSTLVDPGVPIPREVTEVHGISDADVFGMPRWANVMDRAMAMLAGRDFSGHGLRFDVGLFKAECKRNGAEWNPGDAKIVDTLRVFQHREKRDLSAAYEKYCGKKLEGAHRGGVDASAVAEVLAGQLAFYPDLPRDVAALAELLSERRPDWIDAEGKLVWRNGIACVGFGKKHNGTPLHRVDRGYLRWILDNDFPTDTKAFVRAAMDGIYPQQVKTIEEFKEEYGPEQQGTEVDLLTILCPKCRTVTVLPDAPPPAHALEAAYSVAKTCYRCGTKMIVMVKTEGRK